MATLFARTGMTPFRHPLQPSRRDGRFLAMVFRGLKPTSTIMKSRRDEDAASFPFMVGMPDRVPSL